MPDRGVHEHPHRRSVAAWVLAAILLTLAIVGLLLTVSAIQGTNWSYPEGQVLGASFAGLFLVFAVGCALGGWVLLRDPVVRPRRLLIVLLPAALAVAIFSFFLWSLSEIG